MENFCGPGLVPQDPNDLYSGCVPADQVISGGTSLGGSSPSFGGDNSGFLSGLGQLFQSIGGAVTSGIAASQGKIVTGVPRYTSTGANTSVPLFGGSNNSFLLLLLAAVAAILIFRKR